MSKETSAFSDAGSLKGPSHATRKNQAKHVKSCALKYARAILEETGINDIPGMQRIRIGPIKGDNETDRKALSQYDGDRSKVDDSFRMQILTDTPSEMDKMLKLFCSPNMSRNSFHKTMQNVRNITHRKDPKNHVEYPKRWGWQGIIVKPEAKLSNGTSVPFELQIVDRSMLQAYEWSHKEYEKVRTALEEWEDSNLKLYQVLTRDQLEVVQGMLDRHEMSGRKCGMDGFWRTPFPHIGDPPPLVREDDVRDPFSDDRKPSPKSDWDFSL